MKLEIKNLIPKGYEIESFNKDTQTLQLKETPIDPIKFFQTTDDILQYHGLTQKQFDKSCEGLPNSEIGFKWERLIAKAYNLGENVIVKEKRYYPVFYMKPFSFFNVYYGLSSTAVPLALCFKNEKLANDAANKFLPQYELSRLSVD